MKKEKEKRKTADATAPIRCASRAQVNSAHGPNLIFAPVSSKSRQIRLYANDCVGPNPPLLCNSFPAGRATETKRNAKKSENGTECAFNWIMMRFRVNWGQEKAQLSELLSPPCWFDDSLNCLNTHWPKKGEQEKRVVRMKPAMGSK